MTSVLEVPTFPFELTQLRGWGEYISQFEESEYEPLWAFIDETLWVDGLPVEKLPSVDTFRWHYLGKWDSFGDFAIEYALTCDFVESANESIMRYFDFDRYANDLSNDFYSIDAPGYGVWVYRFS